METVELCIDRIENGVVVAHNQEGSEYTFNHFTADIKEGDLVNATFSKNGEIVKITVLHKKTLIAKSSLKQRLSNLFGKQKGAKNDHTI